MIFVLSSLFACQQDLLLLGDLTRIGASNTVAAIPADSVVRPPEPAPVVEAPVAVPVPENGAVTPADARPPAVVPPADGKFNPISVPEGAREGEGVRWEGVKVKGRPIPPPGPQRGPDSAR